MSIKKYKHIIGLMAVSIALFGCQDEQSKPVDNVEKSQNNVDDKQEPETNDKQATTEKNAKDNTNESSENTQDNSDEKEDNQSDGNKAEPVNGTKDESGLIVVNNPKSMEVLVNKQRKLPDGYDPQDLVVPNVTFSTSEDVPKKQMRQEAATALEELFQAAEEAQLDLVAASGYRSYDRQKQIYESNVDAYGQEHADKFSAKPGTSEHQTGLAMDVTTAEVAFALEQTFKQTPEGEWLAENAHKFGFIIRYPEGKSDITGYSYEPWHIRYVGKSTAKEIYESNLTLEEFFGYGY